MCHGVRGVKEARPGGRGQVDGSSLSCSDQQFSVLKGILEKTSFFECAILIVFLGLLRAFFINNICRFSLENDPLNVLRKD